MRLIYTLALTAAAFAASLFFVRRRGRGDWVAMGADALLLSFTIQYLAVGVPGLLRVLSATSIAVTGLLLCGILVWLGWRSRDAEAVEQSAPLDARPCGPAAKRGAWDLDRWTPIACFWVLLGFLAALVLGSLYNPPMSIDALVYHFAAPVDWLQRGGIHAFPLWYGPANTYSPLGGSNFVAWYLAPAGNDAIAKYVQMPPSVLIFFGMILVGRALGVRDLVSALLALAAVLSKPLITEAWQPKDDLYAAAFFIAVIAGLLMVSRPERWGPWRVGIALGLFFAMKFTVLFSVPLFFLAIGATRQAEWRWKHWAIVFALPLLLAGPWYLRNLLLTGNPLYPVELRVAGVTVLPGLFEMQRSPDVASLAGIKAIFLERYHSLPVPLVAVLITGWLCAAIAVVVRAVTRRDARPWRQPLLVVALLGPLLGLALFLLRALYPEIRFLYPSLLLLFACCAVAVARLLPATLPALGAAVVIALVSAGTGFTWDNLSQLLPTITVVTFVGLALSAAVQFIPRLKSIHLATAGGLGLLTLLYVFGDAYVRDYHLHTEESWGDAYREAPAWTFVRRQLPPDATVAMANSNLAYPLQGERYTHRVVVVPTRRDVPDFFHLPRTGKRITGEQMIGTMAELMAQAPDAGAWIDRLRASGARYLFLSKGSYDQGGAGMAPTPPELALVAQHPDVFRKVFETPVVAIYELLPPSP